MLCPDANPGRRCGKPVTNRLSYGTTKQKVNLSLSLFNWALCHKDIRRSGGIVPLILNLSTRWKWVVSFTPLPLYPQGTAPCIHWVGGWLDPRAGRNVKEKRRILPLQGIESRVLACRFTDWYVPAPIRDILTLQKLSGVFRWRGALRYTQTFTLKEKWNLFYIFHANLSHVIIRGKQRGIWSKRWQNQLHFHEVFKQKRLFHLLGYKNERALFSFVYDRQILSFFFFLSLYFVRKLDL
jgi:hypothetical protein